HASQSWQPAPSYVLLAGDATSDPRGYLGPPPPGVPTFMVDTAFGGQTGSDVLFAQLDDDQLPDLALGRLPAREPGQIAAAVAKILAYEQAAAGPWQRSVLAVADGQEPDFKAAADHFLAGFAPPYAAEALSYPPGDPGAPGAVAGRIGEGRLLVAYFGHGSVTQWGKDRLLSSADVPALAAGDRLPIIINMTCLTGLFIHPRQESLAETLLWQPGGGAVALLAPTSLTLPTDQRALSDGLVDAFAGQRIPTLGKALLHAQRRMAAAAAPVDGADDVLQTFLLFGDPALPIAYAAP
ncbi:MAG TPA: C25 family cysteine peptidase, partial [Herpetosiphonaceae bacterium]